MAAAREGQTRPGFDALRLRAELPSFVAALARSDAAIDAPLRSYLAHYGIDFEHVGIRQDIGTIAVDGEQIVAQYFRPKHPSGTAFVLHGYLDHVGLYGHLIRWCLDRGLAVATLDQPGHGLSSGAAATIDSFDRYVSAYRAVRAIVEPLAPTPWHLLGQSMGSAIAMSHLLDAGYRADDSPYRNIVLFAPLVRPYQWSRLRFVYHGLRWFVGTWPRTFGGNSNDEAFTAFLRDADPLQARAMSVPWMTAMVKYMQRFDRHAATDLPVLIVQGDDDKTVDAEHNLARIAGKFASRVHWLPGGKHHLVNESPALRDAMFEGMATHWRP